MAPDALKVRMRQVQLLSVAFITLMLAPPFGLVIAGVLVAACITRRQFRTMWMLLLLSMIAGWLSGIDNSTWTNPLMVSALGMPIGFGVLAGRSYWRVVALSAILVFVVNGSALMGLSEFAADAAVEAGEGIEGADRAQFSEVQIAIYEMSQWVLEHWSAVIVGFTFAGALFSACIVTSLTAWWLRRSGAEAQLRGAFRNMRLPDGLVWCVIIVVGLWFADRERSVGWMQVISWNGAFALLGLYWISGLSIASYAVSAFKPNPFMVGALLVMAVVINALPLLCILGLFDTWAQFRRRIDDILSARELKEDSGDDSI